MKFFDDPMRIALSNELHARPFPRIEAPARAAFLAIRHPDGAARDRVAERAHLDMLLARYSVQNTPAPDGNHFFGQVGKHWLKWESHTEFVTYAIITDGPGETPFDTSIFDLLPADWLAEMQGQRITSGLIHLELMNTPETTRDKLEDWFVGESLAASYVLDRDAVMATDFRLDASDHVRMAVFTTPTCGARRTGRILQRLIEIETYTKMSLMGLPMARDLNSALNGIEAKLTHLTASMADDDETPEQRLDALITVSSALEAQATKTGFRFGATGAYAAIVNQRIQVLREERFLGCQMFSEFMMRRWDPAIRTVQSAEGRLQRMTERGGRASNLLRTRIDVERSAQNQKLLESMDRRADLALRLQETVEGLSVVAISYYAVSLATYLLGPIAEAQILTKPVLTALIVPPVVLAVWAMVRRIKRKLH